MENRNPQIWIILAIIIVIAGIFYYVGAKSEEAKQTTSVESEKATFVPQSIIQDGEPVESVANNLVQDSALGLNCKNVAEAAAQSRQGSGVIVYVIQSNFSKTHNNCYYELNFTYAEGNSSTELHVAPNDDWVAQCTSGIYPSQLFCTAHNTFYPELDGGISEAQYNQIKAQYLKN